MPAGIKSSRLIADQTITLFDDMSLPSCRGGIDQSEDVLPPTGMQARACLQPRRTSVRRCHA